MAISEKSLEDPEVSGKPPEHINVTIVVRTDDATKQPMIRLTTKDQTTWTEEAVQMGYEPISFLGSIPSLCRNSTASRALEIKMIDVVAIKEMIEELLNALIRPMFSLGHQTGRQVGYQEGQEAGDATGYARGKTDGLAEGQAAGYERGFDAGHPMGVIAGKQEGINLIRQHLNFLFSADPAVLLATLGPQS